MAKKRSAKTKAKRTTRPMPKKAKSVVVSKSKRPQQTQAAPEPIVRHVVKRHGHAEVYDEKKIYAACYAAALNCHYDEHDAETLANTVMKSINMWIAQRTAVTSDEIREQILKYIPDPGVALMYKHHLDLC